MIGKNRVEALALADEIANTGRCDAKDAVALATSLLADGVESEAIVLLASESERYPPRFLDIKGQVASMLDYIGVGIPDPADAGWGIALRDSRRIMSGVYPDVRRRSAQNLIFAFYDGETTPDEAFWLHFAEDDTVSWEEPELEELRFQGEDQWHQFYTELARRLERRALEHFGFPNTM